MRSTPTFYEFFAGGGMARLGLDGWECTFANDIDSKKASCYKDFFEEGDSKTYFVNDVQNVSIEQLPGCADLAWASFPCQDLSLAGNGQGLKAARSGTFWPFWSLISSLGKTGRKPRLIALENVYGTLTSHGGRDFRAIADAIVNEGYKLGALVIDASYFLPQSRPRLFIIACRADLDIPSAVVADAPNPVWSPPAILRAHQNLSAQASAAWLWWDVPVPTPRSQNFCDVIDIHAEDVEWHTTEQTARILELMSPVNLGKVRNAQNAGGIQVGGVYRRTRNGVQRAEVRFDGLSGCLRTPAGGSSRQTILVVNGKKKIRSRLLSAREAARLMGLPESYPLPKRYNEAYHLVGDGVVVPVVKHLSRSLLLPLLEANSDQFWNAHEPPRQAADVLRHSQV